MQGLTSSPLHRGVYFENIQIISGALDEIDKLRDVSFKWKKNIYPGYEFNDKPYQIDRLQIEFAGISRFLMGGCRNN